jgi:hypothetical protein
MNKNLVGPFRMRSSYRKRDLAILGDLSVSIEMLASRLGWENELNQMTVRELELIVSFSIRFNSFHFRFYFHFSSIRKKIKRWLFRSD